MDQAISLPRPSTIRMGREGWREGGPKAEARAAEGRARERDTSGDGGCFQPNEPTTIV